MLSNHLVLFHPLFLLPSVFLSIRIFSNESALHIRWPKYWSFNFSNNPSMNIQNWFALGLTGLISLQSKGLLSIFSSTTIWKHQFSGAQSSLWSNSKITADGDYRHEIKRCLVFGRKAMTNLDSILKSRDITLPTKVYIVKAMGFPVVMYGCESWTIKKAEHWRTDTFELWC